MTALSNEQQREIQLALAEALSKDETEDMKRCFSDASWDSAVQIGLFWMKKNLPGGIIAATNADAWQIFFQEMGHLLKRDPAYVSNAQRKACFDELRSRLPADAEKALLTGGNANLTDEQAVLLQNLGGPKQFIKLMNAGEVAAGSIENV